MDINRYLALNKEIRLNTLRKELGKSFPYYKIFVYSVRQTDFSPSKVGRYILITIIERRPVKGFFTYKFVIAKKDYFGRKRSMTESLKKDIEFKLSKRNI